MSKYKVTCFDAATTPLNGKKKTAVSRVRMPEYFDDLKKALDYAKSIKDDWQVVNIYMITEGTRQKRIFCYHDGKGIDCSVNPN